LKRHADGWHYPCLGAPGQRIVSAMTAVPGHLRVEHLDEALGIHVAAPRLSWRLPEGAAAQTGYRITGDNGWDTGRVDDDRSLLVPYTGPPLTSGARLEWRVKTWTDLGESG
jgi:alpha-L-rhamnosidase